MEFWGVEVKSGQPLKVVPGHNMILHVSQACLGELKREKGNESVCLFVNVDGKKLVLGTLFTEKSPQQLFDLVFDRDFELSHNWKNGTVYFCGYMVNNASDDKPQRESDESESESEDEHPVMTVNNEKPESNAKSVKPVEASKDNATNDKESDAGKQKVKIVEPNKEDSLEDDDSSDSSMSDDDDESDSKDEVDSDESDEESPKKAEPSKKRAAESATKTPVQNKMAKVNPQRTDVKKVGGHVDTPHPAKWAGKTPGNKPNHQTQQSSGSHSCKTCSRTFGSEKALESHSKAKHASK